MMTHHTSRRRFLKHSAAAGAAALAAPLATPRIVKGLVSANEKVNLAFIGVGGQGSSNLRSLTEEGRGQREGRNEREGGAEREGTAKLVNVVALCDADENMVNQHVSRFPKAQRHADYRKMLETQKDIDAVVVSTPDHHHAFAAVMAMNFGKHCYCEKPLTHSVYEARAVAEAAARNKVATQMGNSGHSGRGVRSVVDALRAGVVGKVVEAHAWTNRPIWPQGIPRPQGEDKLPPTMNWDLWLGPAPQRPYVGSRKGERTYHPFVWRGWWDFGTGALGDMGCHIIDPIFWGLDLGSPTSVEAEYDSPHNDETAPNWSIVRYAFAARGDRPALKFTWYDGGKLPPRDLTDGLVGPGPDGKVRLDNGVLIVGEKGRLLSDRRTSYRLLPEADFKDFQRPPRTLPESPGHHLEWVNACKGGEPSLANFAYSGPLTEMVLLGNVAIRAGKKIEWDAKEMKVTNAPEANRFVRREYREGWTL